MSALGLGKGANLEALRSGRSGVGSVRYLRTELRELPVGESIYEMEEPEADPSLASAYVFGVPALAALPDGRLLVLEREVFVPRGGVMEKLKGSFTRTRIFRTDPREDAEEPLEKEELIDFYTSARDLADYEGMCLGPAWPGGGRLLLLVADSQEGQGGLLEEWVRVFILPE